MRHFTLATAAAVAALWAGAASAAIMSARFDGLVRADSYDATGLFGSGTLSVRQDEAFSLTYVYDTAFGDPRPLVAGLDRRDGGEALGTMSPVLSVTFTFRGIDTDHSYLTDQAIVQTDTSGFHYINVSKSYETDTRRYIAGMYVFGEGLGVAKLTTPFATALNNGYGIAGVYLLNKQTNGSILNTNFQLKPTYLTVSYLGPSATPDPKTWALLVLGFAVTGSSLRRRAALDRVGSVAGG